MTLPNTTGGPDFGAQIASNPSAPGYDQAEATGRLLMGGGSYSRSGRMVWATGFEGSLLATDFSISASGPSGSGRAAGFGVQLGSNMTFFVAWQGNNALQLIPNAAVNDVASFVKLFSSFSATGKWGLEAMVGVFPTGVAVAYTDFILQVYHLTDPANGVLYTADIRIKQQVPTQLQYMDSAGVFQVLDSDLTAAFGVSTFYRVVKLVADFQKGTYTRFTFGSRTYPMTAPMQAQVLSVRDNGIAQISLTQGTAGGNPVVALDNVILTADEP